MNKQTITFTASEQTLTKTGGIEHYASNIVSYIEASFTLGDNWTGYDSIRAVWESGYARIATVLDANNKCIVPAEVLTYKSKVNVNLVGSIVENTVLTDRLTTYPILALTVDADARVDSSETTPVTASQFEQFVDVVRDEASAIQNYTYDSEAWAVGQRAGVDVPSTDETYQNNAKYYADQGATLQQEVTDLKSEINNNYVSLEGNFNETNLSNDVIKAFETTASQTSASDYFCFDPVMYRGLYKVSVKTNNPITFFVFGVADDSATSMTLLSEYKVTPTNGIASMEFFTDTRSVLGFKGVVNYKTNPDSNYAVKVRNVTYSDGQYTRTTSTYSMNLAVDLSLSISEHSFDDYGDIKSNAISKEQLLTKNTPTNGGESFIGFGDVLEPGIYYIKLYRPVPTFLFVLNADSVDDTSVTIESVYPLVSNGDYSERWFEVKSRSILALKGNLRYSVNSAKDGVKWYYYYPVTNSNGVYTISRASNYANLNLELFKATPVEQGQINLLQDKTDSIYDLAIDETPLISRGSNLNNYTLGSNIFCFAPLLAKGNYKVTVYTSSPINLFMFGASSLSATSLTLVDSRYVDPIDGKAEAFFTINEPCLFGFAGRVDFKTGNVDFYNVSLSNGEYTKPSSRSGSIDLDVELLRLDGKSSASEKYNPAEIAVSDTIVNIKLIGDSITQGSGSTGYVEFVSGGYVYRGNAPDYPSAGADYQIGDYLGSRDSIRWYEAIDGSGWGQLLKAYYEEKFNCVVKNYGMGGANTQDILNNISTLVTANDDVVVVMLGTNDRRDMPRSTYQSNLTSIINYLLSENKKVIMMASIPLKASVDAQSAYFHLEDAANVSSGIASEKNVPFISLYNDVTNYCDYKDVNIDSLLNSDGIHPNDNGYKVMFRYVVQGMGLSIKRDGATW